MDNKEILNKIDNEDFELAIEKYLKKNGLIALNNLVWEVTYRTLKEVWGNAVFNAELLCPALAYLSTKTNLNHKERTALMMIYLKIDKGEERLLDILKSQDNFNENICKNQINSYKKKNNLMGISCEKLIEWGICNSEYSDCPKFEEAKNAKSS
jgi:hypothetical protein